MGSGESRNARTRPLLALATVLVVVAVGCDDGEPEEANPASVFCVEQGGEVEIVDEAGGQVGYCELPDGTRIEEWEYFRSNAPATTVP